MLYVGQINEHSDSDSDTGSQAFRSTNSQMSNDRRSSAAKFKLWATVCSCRFTRSCLITPGLLQVFSKVYPRVGRLYTIMSFSGSVGKLMMDSCLSEIPKHVFSGVEKMLSD